MKTVLIVEDEKLIRQGIRTMVQRSGVPIEVIMECNNGEAALEILKDQKVDVMFTDIRMPKMDGIEVLRRLRADGFSAPVMLLTAKGEKDDRVLGFDAGADDYLPKPFAPDELLSRVRALLRRAGDYKPTVLTFGDLALDCAAGTLTCGRELVRLSGREFQVMELFMRTPRMLLTADRIMEQVWGWDSDAEISVVWVHISNLRKKLKAIGSTVSIHAIRGMGYLLEGSEDHI